MSTDIEPATADRQRARAFRRSEASRGGSGRSAEPPRQRRPALAALAILLIVGGALAAGLLAVRMDERVGVVAANADIPAGTEFTTSNLKEVSVSAGDGVETIPVEDVQQLLGTYAAVAIPAGTLVSESMRTSEPPVSGDRAEVAIPLNPALTPSGLAAGDKVQIVRIGSGQGEAGGAAVLGEGRVMGVTQGGSDSLGGSQTGSINLLVPADSAALVVDAAGAGLAGLAIIDRGQPLDVDLAGPER